MDAPTSRFQLSLSSFLLMSFVACLMFWLNGPHVARCVVPDTSPNRHFNEKEVFWPVLGWPLPVGYFTPEGEFQHEQSYMFPTAGKVLLVLFYLLDFTVAALAVVFTGWISERLQRRQEPDTPVA